MSATLLADGQFLQRSRFEPELFATPCTFAIHAHTQVNIIAPGIISFTPHSGSDKDIVLSSGIHGNETAPIEICDALVQQILLGQLKLAQRVLFIFGNLAAMNSAQRFIDENMNRLFSGAHSEAGQPNNPERQRAALIEQVVSEFYADGGTDKQRRHYDLHTAIKPSKNAKFAVYPFLHGRQWDKQQLAFLLACGINTILLSGSPTTTFSYFSSHRFDAHAFTVELGKVKPFGQNDMREFAAVNASLRALLSGEDLALKPFDNRDFLIYRVNQVINKLSPDFRLHFADDAPNFSDFPQGYLLASDGDIRYHCQHDGEAIVFPNANVATGQRAVLTVIPTTI